MGIYCLLGFPKILQSDNGPEFVNEVIRVMGTLCGIEHRRIAPYNPRTDGKVERTISTVSTTIRKLLQGSDSHWPMLLPAVQFFINTKVSSLTSSCPFSLLFCRPFNPWKNFEGVVSSPFSEQEWLAHVEKVHSVIYPAIHDAVKGKKDAMVQRLDEHRGRLLQDSIPNGTRVMMRDPLRTSKSDAPYIGPYTIARRTPGGTYVLRTANGDIVDRLVPADQLKVVRQRTHEESHTGPAKLDKQYWEVESILDHKGDPPEREYLVKWRGFSPSQATWEPPSSFVGLKAIKKYNRAHKL